MAGKKKSSKKGKAHCKRVPKKKGSKKKRWMCWGKNGKLQSPKRHGH